LIKKESIMFLEPHFKGQRNGWIEVICGPMFSGKTEELIRRMRRATFANQEVVIFKPLLDTRYSEDKVVSHDSNSISSIPLKGATDMLDHLEGIEVVGIDEAQFFGLDLITVCEAMALKGVRVILAGLDMDYKGRPFGPIPGLMAVAEYVTKVHAICQHCGNLATHSYRIPGTEADKKESLGESPVELGANDSYEPRCRSCYHMGNILHFNPMKK
jgi:thymidine kinase